MSVLDRLGLSFPLIQARMAGVSTPVLAAAVSNESARGSIDVGATDAGDARAMIAAVKARTYRAFDVNLFVHASAAAEPARDAAWLQWLAPLFAEFGAEPLPALQTTTRPSPMTATCWRCFWKWRHQ